MLNVDFINLSLEVGWSRGFSERRDVRGKKWKMALKAKGKARASGGQECRSAFGLTMSLLNLEASPKGSQESPSVWLFGFLLSCCSR